MYLLEKFHLVQFYLFSAQTLHFGKCSAIVAPNGSGKSAVLDAMQIVLHGGDQNAIDLNAQSGGHRDGRSIREYLLGYYRDNENVRDNATCYLTMVFRDTTGKHPVVSAGLSLGASLSEPKHRVYGMYILPGVDLKLEEHTQNVGGEMVPLAWSTFKELGRDLTKASGEKPTFLEKGASDFVRALLFQLRANRARSVDYIAFSKALKNALNLKDVHDASAFVRERIVEARPISITEFRHQVETFHDLKRKIASLIERIGFGQGVLDKCRKAISTRMKRASYSALAADLRRDEVAEQLDNAENEAARAEQAHLLAQRQATQCKEAQEATKRHLDAIVQRSKDDPDMLRSQDLQADRERSLVPLKRNLTGELRRIAAAFGLAKVRDSEANGWTFLAKPWEQLLERISATSGEASLKLDIAGELGKLSESKAGCQPLLARVKVREGVDAARLDEAKRAFKTAAEQLERAKAGKGQLPDAVIVVRRLLEEKGISATPVCDLVSVTDPSWAPAIEGYLRANAYALLVEPGREDDALEIYDNIPASYNPFGVKIIQPGRAPLSTAVLSDKALAHLIDGQDAQAVAFLRARLGRLVQLDRAVSTSPDGLTRAGTLVNHGTIERLRLPPASEVTLGKRDARAQIDFLVRERARLANELEVVEQASRRSQGLMEAVAPLGGLNDILENIERWLLEHRALEQELDDRQSLEALQDNPDLLAMRQLLDAAMEAHRQAELAHEQAQQALGGARATDDSARQRVQGLTTKAQAMAQEASRAMHAPFVDAGWIDERRQEWERNGYSLEAMLKRCSDGMDRENQNFGTQESEVRVGIQQYGHQYQFELTVDPSDLDALLKSLEEEIKRLQESELTNYQQQAEDAYGVAVRTFRSRIAASLRSNFDDMENQLRDLDSIMSRLPAFTNDERYQFAWGVNPEYKALHKFITELSGRVGEDDLLNDPVSTPEEFRALLEDTDGPSQELLKDYRKFFVFDVKVKSQGEEISTLKNRMVKGSGGEHRAPLFVVAGAALAAAYGKLQGDTTGMSLILFDELGDKIDGNNTKAVFEYLASLGLQPVVAAPDDALGKINESVDGYVELYRDGAYLSVNHVDLGPEAHELLTSDSWGKHPNLLVEETLKVMEERGIPT